MYNAEKYIARCIHTMAKQEYTKWRAIIIDDASTDQSINVARLACKKYKINKKVTILSNKKNMKQAYSRYVAYQQTEDEEVCVMLDGDDWLFNALALTNLNEVYMKNDVDVTYGGYAVWRDGKLVQSIEGSIEFPEQVTRNKSYRSYHWISRHLRTVRSRVMKSIPKEQLMYKGEWLKCATDHAEMFHALEACDGKHMNNRFIGLVYNEDSSKQYDNSYYNRDKQQAWGDYREEVVNYIRCMTTKYRPEQKNKMSFCITVKNRTRPVWQHKTKKNKIMVPLLLRNLKRLFSLQKSDEHWEICISDWVSTDVPDLREQIVRLTTGEGRVDVKICKIRKDTFSRGYGLNRAKELSESPYLFFLDADMLFEDRTVIERAYEHILNGKAYFPVCYSYTNMHHKDIFERSTGFGNMAIHNKLFERKPGGWLERWEWGKEDNDIYSFFESVRVRDTTGRFTHQWHPHDIKSWAWKIEGYDEWELIS